MIISYNETPSWNRIFSPVIIGTDEEEKFMGKIKKISKLQKIQRDDPKIKGFYAKHTLRCAMRKTLVIFVSDVAMF